MSVGTIVFENKTTDFTSDDYKFEGGKLQVDIAGVLDGANVETWAFGANNIPFRIRTCSWLASDQDVLDGADMGYDYVEKTIVYFKIVNAGASTDITLAAGPIITGV